MHIRSGYHLEIADMHRRDDDNRRNREKPAIRESHSISFISRNPIFPKIILAASLRKRKVKFIWKKVENLDCDLIPPSIVVLDLL